MPRCWHVRDLGKLFTCCLPDKEFYQSFYVGIPFVSFNKIAESETQQIRNCPFKTYTATTKRPASAVFKIDDDVNFNNVIRTVHCFASN